MSDDGAEIIKAAREAGYQVDWVKSRWITEEEIAERIRRSRELGEQR